MTENTEITLFLQHIPYFPPCLRDGAWGRGIQGEAKVSSSILRAAGAAPAAAPQPHGAPRPHGKRAKEKAQTARQMLSAKLNLPRNSN